MPMSDAVAAAVIMMVIVFIGLVVLFLCVRAFSVAVKLADRARESKSTSDAGEEV